MLGLVLSLLVLLAVLLLGGAFLMWRKGAPPLKIILVLMVAGLVIVNILIWAVPYDGGTSPVERYNSAAEGSR